MFGTNFTYVLMRKESECYKIGHTSRMKDRLKTLNRKFGPFCSKRSFVIRADTKGDAAELERSLKAALKPYRFTLPVGRKGNGQTEWFTGLSFERLLASRDYFLSMWMGEGYFVAKLDIESLAPLSRAHLAKLKKVRTAIRRIQAQLTLKWENPENLQKFRVLIKRHRDKFLGVARKLDADGLGESFEIFLKAGACSKQELAEFQSATSMGSSNDHFFAQTNLWSGTTSTREYQRIDFHFKLGPTVHEDSWESAGYIHQAYALFKDLSDAYPLPAEYRQFIGVSIFDQLSEEGRCKFAAAFRQWLFNEVPDAEVEQPVPRRARRKAPSAA